MKFNKNEFGWKEKVSVNTNLNNDTFNDWSTKNKSDDN